ncbi:hypothetical protein [Turkeypox virus]|uniref:Uncharacterized protein n=1 Tax=Turkeypox virus TaxID=336486 RepID=A0A0M5HTP7_9POXV|nr:hypothetical protein ASN15_gp151 [Turkeypox virus]ALA62525.1 hypothetical protein [Turkeypox virus]
MIYVIILFIPYYYIEACQRGITKDNNEYVITICPETTKDCAEWLSIDRLSLGEKEYTNIAILLFSRGNGQIAESSNIKTFDMEKIVLKCFNEHDIYHINIGIKNNCNNKNILESIFIDDEYSTQNNYYNNSTVPAGVIKEYKEYIISIPICLLTIVMIFCCIRYIIRYKESKNIGNVVDNHNFILVSMPPEKAPLFTLSDESINYFSDDDNN